MHVLKIPGLGKNPYFLNAYSIVFEFLSFSGAIFKNILESDQIFLTMLVVLFELQQSKP